MRRLALAVMVAALPAASATLGAQDLGETCLDLRSHGKVIHRRVTISSGEDTWPSGVSIERYRPTDRVLEVTDEVTGKMLKIPLDGQFRIEVTWKVVPPNMAVQSQMREVVPHDRGNRTVKIPLNELRVEGGVLAGGPIEDCGFSGNDVFEADKITVDEIAGALVAEGRLIHLETRDRGGGGGGGDILGTRKGG